MTVRIHSAVLRSAGTAFSPPGARGRLSILIYHRVLPAPDSLQDGNVDKATFAEQMSTLAANFNVLPLGEAVDRLTSGSLPARAACVTFDDGYADNHDVALPILKRHGIPATFFVASGYLDGGRMWNDTVIESVRLVRGAELDLSELGLGVHPVGTPEERCAAVRALLRSIKYRLPAERVKISAAISTMVGADLPNDLMMQRGQVRALHSAGMEIGGHTATHPILSRLPVAEAEREMACGKAELEEIIEAPVTLFAYPNGKPVEDFGPEHVTLARKIGFRAAVTTSWGAARRTSDRFQLPRFTPWDSDPFRFALRLLLNARRSSAATT